MSLATRFRFGSQVCSPPGKAVALLLALILITSGCGLHPVTVAHNEPPSFEEDSTLESWLGSNEEDIREQLGQPTWGLQDSDIRYYVYEGMGQAGQIDLFWWIYPPIVIPLPRHPKSEPPPFETWCLRLTFNPALSAYEKLLKPESAEDCRTAFWWPRSVEAMESAWKESREAEIRVKATAGDRAAALTLASEFDNTYYLQALARDGDKDAALMLARDFGELTYLKALAEEGDSQAAFELAKLGGDLTALAALANQGNAAAAYALYKQLSSNRGKTSEAWKYLCVAANFGNGEAQAVVGYWHRTRIWNGLSSRRKRELEAADVEPNDRIAYMWYTLAIRNNDQYSYSARSSTAGGMTEAQVAQADQMVRDWKPGDCPSAGHRLGPP